MEGAHLPSCQIIYHLSLFFFLSLHMNPVTQGFLTDAVCYWKNPCVDEPSSLLLFHREFTDSCFTFMSDSTCFEWSRVAQWLAFLIGFGLCFPTYVSSNRHLLTCGSTSHTCNTPENSSIHFSVCVSKRCITLICSEN